MKKTKVILVAGARPNFMKVSPLLKEIKRQKGFVDILVHTGQHYDYELSESFFKDLEIRKPDYFLGVGSGTQAQQTAKAMVEFEKVCIKERPRLVTVVGDVNSTLACCVSAKKLNIKVAHIEAGLRSFDLTMPEEINRIVTDSISDYLFVSEKSGISNLRKEGKDKSETFFVGNTMIDSLIFGLEKLKKINAKGFIIYKLKKRLRNYGVITLHRPSNVDEKKEFFRIIKILNKVSKKIPLVFPMHPRTKRNLANLKISFSENIYVIEPLGYLEFLFLYRNARFVLTDSGGLQEETTFLKVPCFTLRRNTERPITVKMGTNILVGDRICELPELINDVLKGKGKGGRVPPLWDGKSAHRIINIFKKVL